MEDREAFRQRVVVVGVAAAVIVAIGAFAAFAVAMCSDLDLRIRGAGQEQVQEVGVDETDQDEQADEPRALSDDEQAFMSFLAGNAWFDSLGETSVSFTESEIVFSDGGEEQRWGYELVSLEVEPAAKGASRQVAVLLVDGAEKKLTIDPYDPVWSYEQHAYEGPYSDCYLSSDFFDMAYYRYIADARASGVVVLPNDLIAETFGDRQPQLAEAINAYCKENLPKVTEVTYTGDFLVDPATGVEAHIFACKGVGEVFLTVTYDDAEQRFVVENM